MPGIQEDNLVQSVIVAVSHRNTTSKGRGTVEEGGVIEGGEWATWRVRFPERFIEPRVGEEVVKWRMTVLVSL